MKHYTVRMHRDLFGHSPATPGGSITHNLFFGLLPDEKSRQQMADAVKQLRVRHAIQGRWIKPERYHLTLHYLGTFSELPEALMERARAAAGSVRVPAFPMTLERAGHFGQGVGWLGTARVDASLQRLWEALRSALTQEHVRIQGHASFKPHVTVLRDAHGGMPAEPIEPVVWPVRDFALIDSQLGARNEHVVVQRWPLG
jgi:2'-5' RNA ligase